MNTNLSIVIQSHLSDSLIETSFNVEQANLRIRFVKYLINRFGDDINQRVDIDKVFNEFLETQGETIS
jgi:predicted lipase